MKTSPKMDDKPSEVLEADIAVLLEAADFAQFSELATPIKDALFRTLDALASRAERFDRDADEAGEVARQITGMRLKLRARDHIDDVENNLLMRAAITLSKPRETQRTALPDEAGAFAAEHLLNASQEAALHDLIERLVPRWISVEERLPVDEVGIWSEPVLVSFDSGTMAIEQCILYSTKGADWNLAPGVTANVTHWQPRPDPPQKGST